MEQSSLVTKDEALELLVSTKSAPALSRSFIAWLYKNGYEILTPDEVEKVNGMIVMAHVHGMNPFEKK